MAKIIDKIEISQKKASLIKKNITDISSLKKEIEKNLDRETTELIGSIMLGGIYLSASDIHLEPKEKETRMRIRTDGMLHDVLFFSPEKYRLLLSRIKLLSGMKLNIYNKPQDGSFGIALIPDSIEDSKEKMETEESPLETEEEKEEETEEEKEEKEEDSQTIEIRVSVLPADFGESVVMRILNPKNLKSIEQLGIRKDLLAIFKKEIGKPNGMIVVTGPTGSGKTTTLYAFLKHIQKPEIKIITVEDPIEYRLEGISQTEIDAKRGYSFANGLRSIVRQDPDVILVGEVRDLETAEISLQAALTGHLVFSTLHTNDAAGTIPRLISLGAEPINMGPAINMVIAQRLVREVCKKCATLRTASLEEVKIIRDGLKDLPEEILSASATQGKIKIPEIKGCKHCNFTGYRGRIGIFEIFLIDDEAESLILKRPAISEIKKLISEREMFFMRQDGLIKMLQGVTTLKEVERVTSG